MIAFLIFLLSFCSNNEITFIIYTKIMDKYLVISNKSSIFAPENK